MTPFKFGASRSSSRTAASPSPRDGTASACNSSTCARYPSSVGMRPEETWALAMKPSLLEYRHAVANGGRAHAEAPRIVNALRAHGCGVSDIGVDDGAQDLRSFSISMVLVSPSRITSSFSTR